MPVSYTHLDVYKRQVLKPNYDHEQAIYLPYDMIEGYYQQQGIELSNTPTPVSYTHLRLLFVRMYLSNSNIYVNEIINKIIKLKEVLSIIKNTMFKKFHTNLKLNKNRLTFLHPFSYAEN